MKSEKEEELIDDRDLLIDCMSFMALPEGERSNDEIKEGKEEEVLF
jgi:hypothetical protein